MPVVIIDEVDLGPQDLRDQLPLRAELLRVLRGDDRTDYTYAILDRPLKFLPGPGFDLARVPRPQRFQDSDGAAVVGVGAVVMTPRSVGQQFGPEMTDLWVSLAYVIDPSVKDSERLDLAKVHPAAVVRVNLDPSTDSFRRRT